ncbi:MAG: hypothetical protein E4H08_09495 [Candidatus Atribacteria bacterium]|nr:MAG: hypothetical protein E4H08_09495 [Candidatus Atribacteria bacterium]
MHKILGRTGQVLVVLAGVAGILTVLGAASLDGITPGTRVAGTHPDAILTVVNESGAGDTLRARNNGSGSAVAAWSASGYGVHALADAANRSAVIGLGTAAIGVNGRSDTNDGVVGVTQAAGKSGVWGHSVAGIGVTGSSDSNNGIVGFSQAPDRSGIFGYNDQGVGVTAQSSAGTALYVRGTSIFERYASFQGGHGDLAENYSAGEPLGAGDVVTISSAGGLALVLARAANDTSVAGVVATDPSLRLAGGIPDAQSVPLAIAGRVLCKVDASLGAIAPGDLLTTSPTPGHAMRATPVDIGDVQFYRPGTILGKALEACEEGIGLIQILITLQ